MRRAKSTSHLGLRWNPPAPVHNISSLENSYCAMLQHTTPGKPPKVRAWCWYSVATAGSSGRCWFIGLVAGSSSRCVCGQHGTLLYTEAERRCAGEEEKERRTNEGAVKGMEEAAGCEAAGASRAGREPSRCKSSIWATGI